jgi:hypothetical protein
VKTQRDKLNPAARLAILSLRSEADAKAAWHEVFKAEIDVQAVVDAFEQTVLDAIVADDESIEIPVDLAEAIAVLLKSTKPSTKPRTHWRDRITQAAAVEYARSLSKNMPKDRAAAKAAQKVSSILKKFSAGTIKDRMTRRKPRSGK